MELRPFVAVLLRITYDLEHYMSQSWDAADSGELKAMIKLATSFVYTPLMGRYREMKPVPAAVQISLQIQLGIKVSVWSHLQENDSPLHVTL